MKTLQIFKTFVDEINQSNSNLYKKDILKKYADNQDVKDYLYFLFNPYIVTGISSKKITKIQTYKDSSTSIDSVKDLLQYIIEHNTGTDDVLQTIFNFKNKDKVNPSSDSILYNGISEPIVKTAIKSTTILELEALLDKLITKSLSLGIDALTINKIIPDLIPTFSVQLANKYFQHPECVEDKEFAITNKIDGGRIIAIKQNNEVKFYTRAGQPYLGLVDLEKEMFAYMPDNICLDGEITLLNKADLVSKEQYKETMKIVRKDGEKHDIKMLVFDCMTADEFHSRKCETPYSARRSKLNEIFKGNLNTDNHEYKYFNLLPILYQGNDISQISKWLKYNVSQGEEGIMINILDAPYEFTRTSNLLKCKLMKDIDLEIIGYKEGKDKFKGSLGAFIVRYKNNEVRVGSGIEKTLRAEIWKNPESYVGRTISVQYFEETKNAQGKESLRFPVFCDFRDDKSADC